MSEILIKLSYVEPQFVAEFSFNRIKMSTTITDSSFEVFCKKLAEELRSTPEKVIPLPGRSSSDIARFDPTSVSIYHHETLPIDASYLGPIQLVISEFVEEKVESANLFAETQVEVD